MKRRQLRDFATAPPDPIPIMSDPFTSVKTTDIYITTESAISTMDTIDLEQLGGNPSQLPRRPVPAAAYTVTITGQKEFQQPEPLGNVSRFSYTEKDSRQNHILSPTNSIAPLSAHQPNSGNNLYSTRRYATMEANTAIWSYTKVAVLFFFAMMITWTPSSANRVYSVVHPEEVCLALEYASAFVLPLQGFWNALIYAMTSLPACKEVWTNIRHRRRFSGDGAIADSFSSDSDLDAYRLKQGNNKFFPADSESMTELQTGRPETTSRPSTKQGR